MDENNVEIHAEKRLFADVELIKQQQQHADTTLQNLLKEFIDHSKATTANLQDLTLSLREMVLESRSSNKRIEELERQHDTHTARSEDNFRSIGQRVASLETWRTERTATEKATGNYKKWWSDNWHKILTVVVMLGSMLFAVYEVVKAANGG